MEEMQEAQEIKGGVNTREHVNAPLRARMRRGGKRKGREDERGIALLLVLSSLTLMTLAVYDFKEEQTSDLYSAFAERDALQAEYMARSAVNLSRLFVASEPVMRQALGILQFMFGGKPVPQLPVWEFADTVLGTFSDKEGQEGFGRLGGFQLGTTKNLGGPDGAKFTVVVVDEDAKINLNLGARGNVIAENRFGAAFLGLTSSPAFDTLFEHNDRDGKTSDRVTICGALIDWADPDENRYACDPRNFQGGGGAAGVEDQSYLQLKRPYRVKNAPYDSLEEAHLVRGVGDDFWATFVDPDPASPKKRVMTVWGQGPINVNTASPQAVLAVVCGLAPDATICTDLNQNAQFLTMFGVLRSFTSGMPLFGAASEFITTMQGQGNYGKLLFETLKIPPVRFQSPAEAAKNFTTESKVFSIYATGEVAAFKRTTKVRIHAVVDFRGSPPIPTVPAGFPQPPGAPGATPPGSPPPPPPITAAAGSAAGAINGALVSSPAGTVVYYRIE
ncbi:MAG: hypothetical protein NVS3B20_03540 [Polyangiales bacterium]